jgi:hypothetical protein
MAQVLWSQDIFTKGEISPLMYARVSVAPYYNGLKRAKNVIGFPQGAAGKRFGTIFRNIIPGVTDASQIFFATMQYLNECVYLILFLPGQINIYLEGTLAAIVTGSPILANAIRLIDHTILDDIFRVTTGVLPPQDLTRTYDAAVVLSNFNTTTNIVTMTSSLYITGQVLPARFNVVPNMGNVLFGTNPQIFNNKTYFIYFLSPTTFQIYLTPQNAISQTNPFSILNAGTGIQYLYIANTWSIAQTPITTYPVFDFNQNYLKSSITFTPSATTGNAVILTTNTPSLISNQNFGGTFSGNGGLGRIVGVNPGANFVLAMTLPFISTEPILGSTAQLTEPAWSSANPVTGTTGRGWPSVCSSFQNRAFFANTDLLPNGLWGSVTNDYNSFDDSRSLDDNAISWYPTSDDINFIRFIVPYRSLTIHTNSGVFSTPLSVETAITPSNFSLTLQDSTPAESVQPRGIDNQIVILSGNDAHSLLWDGFNNAYQSSIISIANEHLIDDPVDEAAFVDLTRAGSRYMLIVNSDGSLAIYQTLISEEVQGFTPAYLEQPYGNAYFRWVATSFDGRGWFVTERQIPTGTSTVALSSYTPTPPVTGTNIFTAPSHGMPLGQVTAIMFSTSGTLLTTNPQVQINKWYWAIPIDANTFYVYQTISDSKAVINQVIANLIPINNSIITAPLVTQFFIEELNFKSKVDCANFYINLNSSTLPNAINFTAQSVKINGDGYGFDGVGANGVVPVLAHGIPTIVNNVQVGFPINIDIKPLQLSIFQGATKQSNLLTPKHIRDVQFMFNDTVGGEVNGIPISMQKFDEIQIGQPPMPYNGIFEYGIMQGWDDFKDIGITITHNEPFDFKLIGIFYKVDV